MIDRIDGSPERVLNLAAASTQLAYDGVVKHYGLSFDVVSFPWRNGRMRIELSRRNTFARTPSRFVRPYVDNFRWAPFGDVTMRTDYVDWNVTPVGRTGQCR